MIIKCPRSCVSRDLQNEHLQFRTNGQFIFFGELNTESKRRSNIQGNIFDTK